MPFSNLLISNRLQALLFIICFSHAGAVIAQAPIWVSAQHYGASTNEYLQKVRTDSQGNRFLIGIFSDTVRMGNTTLSNSGTALVDMFVAKTDPSGTVLWAHNANPLFTTVATDLTIDGTGNCYITGYFRWRAQFGNIQHWDTLYQKARVMFLTKINPAGNIEWSMMENDVNSTGTSLGTDAAGNVYLSGIYSSSPGLEH